MKKSSIRKRITIYYTAVLIVMYVIICGVFLLSSNSQFRASVKDNLVQAVQSGFDNIEFYNNTIEVKNSFTSYYKGSTLMIYSDSGIKIKGNAPDDFPVSTRLESGEFHEVKTDDDRWLIYDLYNSYDNGRGIWVRGIYPLDISISAVNKFVKFFILGFLMFILIAAACGYYIARKGLLPIAKITETADRISGGNDLSVRLPECAKKDELYYLTNTLNMMLDRLEKAFNSEKQFTSDVSHELKTPVSVILTECEYTLNNAKEICEYKESLSVIQHQCSRMMSLIQQLLQMSHAMSKSNVLEIEEFDVSILCSGLVEELTPVASKNGVILKSDIQPDVIIKADETLVMRMLINLITNAIKYRNVGRLDSFAILKLASVNGNAVFTVSDNGQGISEEDLPDIFNRFFKGDKARTMNEESFGLGLSMVKWIAEAHDGNVICRSREGEGTEFIVNIPITRD